MRKFLLANAVLIVLAVLRSRPKSGVPPIRRRRRSSALELDRLLPRRPCGRPVGQEAGMDRPHARRRFFRPVARRTRGGERVGGVQAGCDYQFAGGFVLGIQGDYAWADAEGSHDSALEFGVAYHSKIRSLASVTGRIGYAWDRFLGYVKGGGAWERDDYSASTIVLGTAYTARETRSGWTIGLGAEYAFSKVPVRLRRIQLLRFRHPRDWFHAANTWVTPGIRRYQSHHERRARRTQPPSRRLGGSDFCQVASCGRSRRPAPAAHSITSSARPSSVSGKVRPSALAVFMLITSSTFVDWWIGRSAGFSPPRIRPA